MLTREEAALYLGYQTASAAFDSYCARIGVVPLEKRKGAYDRLAIDRALDRASGLVADDGFETVDYG